MYVDFLNRSGSEGPSESLGATTAFRDPERRRSRWQRVLREPLTHFIIAGLAIFVVSETIKARSDRYTIAITPDQVTQIVNTYAQQYGAEPTPAQLRTMLDNYIKEEIFLREGRALGLDKEDEIVRRRIAQKFDFLQQDLSVPVEPSEAQLRAYYDGHRGAYVEPPRRSFEQIYFAMDERGEAAAKALAQGALLHPDAAAGDDFPGPKTIENLSEDEMNRLFGSAEFAHSAFSAPAGKWTGPFRSGYGWHLLRTTNARAGRQLSFDSVRDQVAKDWKDTARREAAADRYRKLRSAYHVVAEPGA